MSLTYTDAQLESMSSEYLGFDAQIAKLEEERANLEVQQIAVKKKDDENSVSTDNYESILASYHAELQYLNGQVRTNYNHAMIDEAAQRGGSGGGHYPMVVPSNMWTKVKPKIIPSGYGNPVGTLSPIETDKTADIVPAWNMLMNAWEDGDDQTYLTEEYEGSGVLVVYSYDGFAPGQRVVIEGGGHSMYGIVTAAGDGGYCTPTCTPNTKAQCTLMGGVWTVTHSLTIEVIVPPEGIIPIGSSVRNYHAAFTEYERTTELSSSCPHVLSYFKDQVDQKVQAWLDLVVPQVSALASNSDLKFKAHNVTAKANVDAANLAITTWQGYPREGAIGRFRDITMNALYAAMTTRNPQIPERASQILADLGSLSQDGEGNYTGSGNYYDLFLWVDIRVGIAGGTLATYYAITKSKELFDIQIDKLKAKRTEYVVIMDIQKLTANPDGTSLIKIENAAGLSVGDSLKMFATGQTPLTVTILGISGNDVQVSMNIPQAYSLDNVGRVVKKKY